MPVGITPGRSSPSPVSPNPPTEADTARTSSPDADNAATFNQKSRNMYLEEYTNLAPTVVEARAPCNMEGHNARRGKDVIVDRITNPFNLFEGYVRASHLACCFWKALYLEPPPSWQENQNGEAYNITNPRISTYSLLVIKPETSQDGDVKEKKPTLAESFEKISKAVEKYDEEQVKGWKEDIDTLLVFAGLFSAVVTAFLIEAYQKLQEDPADKTVTLLEKLVALQQPNASQTAIISSDSNPFTPDASTIRINCFWLLSLIFSLTSALFGLLCKQWIREYQREPPTRSPGEALALRQLRRDSFDKWGVPGFLSALPILLEIALLLFFAGILDLLWGLHRIPFVVSLVAVGLSAGLYIVTTLLPTLTIPKDQKWNIEWRKFERLSYQFICPYKSPQAWLFYRFVCKVLHPLSKFWLSTREFERRNEKPALALRYHIESPASDWSSFDLRVARQYDQHVQDYWQNNLFSLQVYQLRAFEWAVTMFRDSPLMIPHLQNVLGTIPPSVAMSAVLGHSDVALWSDVSRADVELGVADPEGFRRQYMWNEEFDYLEDLPRLPQSAIPDPAIFQPDGIKSFFQHQYLMTGKGNNDIHTALERMGMQTAGFHFVAPLSVLGSLWAHQDAGVRKQSLALLRLYKESWKSCSSVAGNKHRYERLAFVLVLAKLINHTDRTSVLITSKRGREFIRFIHHEIINQGFYSWGAFDDAEWLQAIERSREVGDLPPNYFAPLPSGGLPPVLPPLPPRRYSLETVPDVELNHDNEALDSQPDGSLPSGWEQLTTPEGRPYFFDHKIGTVTWEDPRQNIPMASDSRLDGPLPPGWERRTTTDDRPYFSHWDTGTATWLDPRRCTPAGGQVGESSGSGNPQASGSRLEGPLPSGWEQRTILGTPYFIDLNTRIRTRYYPGRVAYAVTWKDPRQIEPAGQVAESSGSGNQQTSQDDDHATSSRSQAIDTDTNIDSGALPEADQQSNSDPAPDGAEVEASSKISSSNPLVDAPMSSPSDSSPVRPIDHPTEISHPLEPNRDTQESSMQDHGEVSDDDDKLVIQIGNTFEEVENAGNSYAPRRGHTDAGGDGPSHSDSAHLQRHVEGAGADRTLAHDVVHPELSGSSARLAEGSDDEDVLGPFHAAPSTGNIDTENTNVVQSPASGEHTISQDAPPPLVDPGVNEQMNHLAARTEEQHARSSRDTELEENIHPENLSMVIGEGRGASTVDLGHLSGKDKDYHSPLSGETDTSCLDNPESTARARDAAFGFSAHSGQDDEQAFGARSEQDVPGSNGSQRKEDGRQAAHAHPEVEYSNESRSGVHDDAEILRPDQDIDTRNPNVVTQSPERTVSQDPPSPPVDEQVAHTEEQAK
ncbi:hypothetical protein VNI00_010805 [Paramarasmius palmivorus]|uniref:WW domain-containing protein n=1 Tax=Paramarasmius palmivorus TaxID=297713 RepID=A0AAW0CFB2_9AGAR